MKRISCLLAAVLVAGIAGCARQSPGQARAAGAPATSGVPVADALVRHADVTPGAAVDVTGIKAPDGMVAIPAGPFFRGCSDGFNGVVDDRCAPSEKPAGMVDVGAFFIDVNEVTVGRYRACVDSGACKAPYDGGECNFGDARRMGFAINCVTWEDARRFCAWEGKRLPTEAEWEKAARGTDGRKYPWGNDEPDRDGTWRANLGEGLTKLLWMRDQWEYDGPVGFFSKWPSPYGCNDMAGNMAEWVSDWWADSYPAQVGANPGGPAGGDQKVVRGGSFREYRQRIRTAARGYHYVDFMDGNVGFRCAGDVRPGDVEPR